MDYKPSRTEWIKGIFLAYSNALGRFFDSRIVPAIKFETHFNVHFPGEDVWKYNYDFFYEFKYCKMLAPFRRNIVAQASMAAKWVKSSRNSGRNFIDQFVSGHMWNGTMMRMFVGKKDRRRFVSRMLRLEDLKLYPRATLKALCEYLDIPWDDLLLKTTGNGVGYAVLGTKDFDPAPVYKRYFEICNPFDYYRLEVLMSKYWKHFGYKPLFYKEDITYSKEEILKMFELPFQCEKYHVTEEQKNRNISARKKMYQLVEKRLSEGDVPLDENGQEMVPIPWLKPKMELVDGELYK